MIFKPYFMYRNAKTPKAEGTSITLWKAASGTINTIQVKGKSEVINGSIKSVGDAGWGAVDLGTLTWTYERPYGNTVYAFTASLSNGMENNVDVTKIPTILISNEYQSSFAAAQASNPDIVNKSYTIYNNKQIILDTSYSDATTFKTAMSGVILYYPLASTTGATPTLGIISKGDTGHGTAATITTGLPLRSVSDSVYDTLNNNEVVKKCAEVDLGDLTWYKSGVISNTFYINPTDFDPSSAGIPNGVLMGGNYTYVTYNALPDNDKVYSTRINQGIYILSIRDTAYSDVSTFKTAVTGIKLVYPIDTPITTNLTGAEITALASLNTYLNKTEIDNTDNAEMIITYNRTI